MSSAVGTLGSLRSRSARVLLTVSLSPLYLCIGLQINHLPDNTSSSHAAAAYTQRPGALLHLKCSCTFPCVGRGVFSCAPGFPVTLHPTAYITGVGRGTMAAVEVRGQLSGTGPHLPPVSAGQTHREPLHSSGSASHLTDSAGTKGACSPAFLHAFQKLNSGSQVYAPGTSTH